MTTKRTPKSGQGGIFLFHFRYQPQPRPRDASIACTSSVIFSDSPSLWFLRTGRGSRLAANQSEDMVAIGGPGLTSYLSRVYHVSHHVSLQPYHDSGQHKFSPPAEHVKALNVLCSAENIRWHDQVLQRHFPRYEFSSLHWQAEVPPTRGQTVWETGFTTHGF